MAFRCLAYTVKGFSGVNYQADCFCMHESFHSLVLFSAMISPSKNWLESLSLGPNGSGKSNIVDAMLWALANARPKLCAAITRRMLFSMVRPAVSRRAAPKSISFSITKAAFCQLTLRKFRSRANCIAMVRRIWTLRSKCRLRDVLDLFLDTGVGPDAGASSRREKSTPFSPFRRQTRPHRRRGGCGSRTSPHRNSQALGVVIDLIRVADITSELESQIGPLSLQAEVAREYDSLVSRSCASCNSPFCLAIIWAPRTTRKPENGPDRW